MKIPKKVKIDITSSAAEDAFDAAKKFLSKLVKPTIEELGLLGQDAVREWRFRRQVKMLQRSSQYCMKHNISPKAIPLKTLAPLIDMASFEDDDYLLDRWAILLGNLVDSGQNAVNNIYPFILSQISRDELVKLEKVHVEIMKHILFLEELHQKAKDPKEIQQILDRFRIAQHIHERQFEGVEIPNLVRLGVLKAIPIQSGKAYGMEIITKTLQPPRVTHGRVEIEHEFDAYVITNLGESFLEMVNEKQRPAMKTRPRSAQRKTKKE